MGRKLLPRRNSIIPIILALGLAFLSFPFTAIADDATEGFAEISTQAPRVPDATSAEVAAEDTHDSDPEDVTAAPQEETHPEEEPLITDQAILQSKEPFQKQRKTVDRALGASAQTNEKDSLARTANSEEQFRFEVTTPSANTTFFLPTSGQSGGKDKEYSWTVDWGDGSSGDYTQADSPNKADSAGVQHTYATANTYTITITPNGSTEAWLASFGFHLFDSQGANSPDNRSLVTQVISPITPLMTRTEAEMLGQSTPSNMEWAYTFYGCANITMGPQFTFDNASWNNVTSIGDYFAYYMFYGCSGNAFTMGGSFNFPAFENVTSVGDYFAQQMFQGCSGAAFNMNDSFNLPAFESVTSVGRNFAHAMFSGCKGVAFTMNDSFNLPAFEKVTSINYDFASFMFYGCSGNAFTMNGSFNFPAFEKVTSVGTLFASSMFYNCSGNAFTMNDSFNFPAFEDVISFGNNFAQDMFSGAGGSSFQVNDVFKFPRNALLTAWGNSGNLERTFYSLAENTPVQNRSANSIINGNAVPMPGTRNTFAYSDCFLDWKHLALNWGGNNEPCTIISTAGAGGMIDPLGQTSVTLGEEQSYEIEAEDGYIIASVIVDDIEVIDDLTIDGRQAIYTFDNVERDHNIEITFEQGFIITSSAGIGGTVTPAGATPIKAGEDQDYAITAETGFILSDVLVDGTSVGVLPSYTFSNVDDDHTIEARFIETHPITSSAGAGGNIDPAGTTLVKTGESQSYTIAANNGFIITDVLVDGISVFGELSINNGTTTYTFENVQAGHTIAASFESSEINSWFIGSSVYVKKSTQDLTFVADKDYSRFTQVRIDDAVPTSEEVVIASGSTVATLTPSYLDTLTTGQHRIELFFNDGTSASSFFEVKEAAVVDDGKDPISAGGGKDSSESGGGKASTLSKTLDATPIFLLIIVAVLSLGLMLTVSTRGCRKTKGKHDF